MNLRENKRTILERGYKGKGNIYNYIKITKTKNAFIKNVGKMFQKLKLERISF